MHTLGYLGLAPEVEQQNRRSSSCRAVRGGHQGRHLLGFDNHVRSPETNAASHPRAEHSDAQAHSGLYSAATRISHATDHDDRSAEVLIHFDSAEGDQGVMEEGGHGREQEPSKRGAVNQEPQKDERSGADGRRHGYISRR